MAHVKKPTGKQKHPDITIGGSMARGIDTEAIPPLGLGPSHSCRRRIPRKQGQAQDRRIR